MILFEITPEHVLDAIRGVEDADEAALAEPIEGGDEQRLTSITPSLSAHVSSARPSVEYGPMRLAR